MRRSVEGESIVAMTAARIGTCGPSHLAVREKLKRGGLSLPDEIWDGMTISIDKIEAALRKAGVTAKEEANRGGI